MRRRHINLTLYRHSLASPIRRSNYQPTSAANKPYPMIPPHALYRLHLPPERPLYEHSIARTYFISSLPSLPAHRVRRHTIIDIIPPFHPQEHVPISMLHLIPYTLSWYISFLPYCSIICAKISFTITFIKFSSLAYHSYGIFFTSRHASGFFSIFSYSILPRLDTPIACLSLPTYDVSSPFSLSPSVII